MVTMNLASIGVIGAVISLQARGAAENLGGSLAQVRARQLAEEFDNFLQSHWSMVSSTVAIVSQFESIPEDSRREFLSNAARSVVEAGAFVANSWIIWDANALDGADSARIGYAGTNDAGRFVPGYVRNRAGNITLYLRRDFDNDNFYFLPRVMNRQIITNPYERLLANEVRNIATISAPVRNSAGAIVGIVGIDIDLDILNDIGQNFTRVFQGTLTAAFSNNGTIVSHFDRARIGRNMRETEADILGEDLHLFAAAIQNGTETNLSLRMGRDQYLFFSIPIPIADFSDDWALAIAIPMDEVLADSNATIIFAIVLCAVMLALAIFVSLFVSKRLAKPIVDMAEILNDIANGDADMTKRLPEKGNDEIGAASRYFNQTMEGFRQMIIKIKNKAATLSEIGNDLASNMIQTAGAMNEITANIHGIKGRVMNQSASVSETGATMEQVTMNIDKLNTHIERQSGAVAQASSAIEEMLANIRSVTTTLVKNSENVRNLQESSETGRHSLQDVAADIQEISRESEGLLEINAVMENIASQTNLLSMNAAIEAAHAGESGKGFAVVADEIRKLAESSGDQSKTIGSVLKKIKEAIDKIMRSTDNVLDKFESIDRGVRVVSEQEELIRAAMEEQREGSRQVLSASGQVSDITQEVKSGSSAMLEGSREVIQESRNLESATQEITGGVNEMATGAGEINRAVNSINELSERNRENIAELVRAVAQFKV